MPSKAMPISWHENNIKNNKDYAKRLLAQAKLILEQYAFMKKKIKFYQYQINEAKKQEREMFDSERFCIKRKKEDD